MKILVACEESQAVTKELRKLGHEAYSCDIIECSGNHSEWHIMQDVIPLLNGNCEFRAVDGTTHKVVDKWDMIIAFPPCTYLTSAGTRHYSLKMNPAEKVEARIRKREKAIEFFMLFANADCDKIAIENPVGYMNTHWRKPNQIIHPYYFGDNAKKRTCLWLKGLPELKPTNMLPEPEPMYVCEGEKCKGKNIGWCEGMRGIKGGQKERARARSKTFPGIAKAMAEQWTKGATPMRVYISGKITGTADYLARFEKAEKYLEQQGYSVVNPAWINFQLPRDTTHEQYMTVSLALLSTCDKMYMLRGWETSKGANAERDYAIRNDIPVEFERER